MFKNYRVFFHIGNDIVRISDFHLIIVSIFLEKMSEQFVDIFLLLDESFIYCDKC